LLYPNFPDTPDASSTVGTEDKTKHLGHETVVFFAIGEVVEEGAVGTGSEIVFHATGSHLAPGSFFIFPAAGAFVCKVFLTSPTI
jgi:hypothetical protein